MSNPAARGEFADGMGGAVVGLEKYLKRGLVGTSAGTGDLEANALVPHLTSRANDLEPVEQTLSNHARQSTPTTSSK